MAVARKKSSRSAAARKGQARKPASRKTAPRAPQFDSLQQIALTSYRKLKPAVWDHLVGGADSEMTLRRNRAGLDALALRQRVLVDVRKIDLGTTLLGQPLSFPVFPAPVGGFLSKVHAEGGPGRGACCGVAGHDCIHCHCSQTQPGGGAGCGGAEAGIPVVYPR